MTDAVAIVALVVAALAIAAVIYATYRSSAATDRGDTFAKALATEQTSHAVTIQERDAEHIARVAAEADRDALTKQLAATQAADNLITQEHLHEIHDAVAAGDPARAIAVIRGVYASATAVPAARPGAGGGAVSAPPAVQPAAAAGTAAVANPHPGS